MAPAGPARDEALAVDLGVMQVVAGRLTGLTHRLREAQDEVRPSTADLGDARLVDAWDILTARWESAGRALAADVTVATGHLHAAVEDYTALERDLAARPSRPSPSETPAAGTATGVAP